MIYIDDEKDGVVKVSGREDVVINETFLILGTMVDAIEKGIIDRQTLQDLCTDINLLMLLDFLKVCRKD